MVPQIIDHMEITILSVIYVIPGRQSKV